MGVVAAEAGKSSSETFLQKSEMGAQAVSQQGERSSVFDQKATVIEGLKAQIRRLQAAPRRYLVTLSTGTEALDALGVFRLGSAVELSGEEASGRTTVAFSLVAAACREKRLSAWVDGPSELYMPSAISMGVDWRRLLIVRPQAPRQLVWAAVQLLRSGAFTCVVLDVTHTGVRLTPFDAKKLLDAARSGGSLLVVLTSHVAHASGLVRLVMALRTGSTFDDVQKHDLVSHKHLRVVREREKHSTSSIESSQFHVTVARSNAMTGKQLIVPYQKLAKRPATFGAVDMSSEGLSLPSMTAKAVLQRPKKNELRDGGGFKGATRPGRDGAMSMDEFRSCVAQGTRRRPASKLAAVSALGAKPNQVEVQIRSFR